MLRNKQLLLGIRNEQLYGPKLAQIVFKGSHVERVSNAIHKIKTNFHEPIKVEQLAEIAGMSVFGFYANFKAVTSMSPLQFQKELRLIEARNLMLTGGLDVSSAAHKVGYESASHFNREYSRMFGSSPTRDVNSLKKLILLNREKEWQIKIGF